MKNFIAEEGLRRPLATHLSKIASDISLPAEVVRRLRRLDNDVERYQAESKDLRDRHRTAEREATDLQDEITGQRDKSKGAGKKVRNVRGAAGKEEGQAKSAVLKKQRVKPEHEMKHECNQSVAEVARLSKQCDDLKTHLEVERAGKSHLRVEDPASDAAVAVIPVGLSTQRARLIRQVI